MRNLNLLLVAILSSSAAATDVEGIHAQTEADIKVIFTDSHYRTAEEKPKEGWFSTGQEADLVLGWYGFGESGGPLSFNHPMGIATDGRRLLLADTRNNRVLIWNELPDGNVPPDLVLGQPNFETNEPGGGLGELNWPVGVATDGTHVAVADACNNRILIWNEFPSENGQPADVVIEDSHERRIAWPWAVRIVDGKLIVTDTADWKVYVWNEVPKRGDVPPDLVLTGGGMFGTPRGIWSDGKRLVIVDHNIHVEDGTGFEGTVPGLLFWNEFPKDDEPPDFYMEGLLWGPAMTHDGKFMALNNYGLAIWDSFPKGKDDKPDLIVGSPDIGAWMRREEYRFDDGDGSGIAVAGDRLYISLYNSNMVVGYRAMPRTERDLPDFSIGSSSIWVDPMEENYFFEGPFPVSDGKHLFVVSGFDRRLCVWRAIPEESGAAPDVVYTFPFEPTDAAVCGDVLALGTTMSVVYIWNSLPLNGELPDVRMDLNDYFPLGPEGGREPVSVNVALDEGHLYALAGGNLFIWDGIPEEPRPPDRLVLMPEGYLPFGICVDGRHLIFITREREVEIFDLEDVIAAAELYEYPQPAPPEGSPPPEEGPESPMENLPHLVLTRYRPGETFLCPMRAYSDGRHLFVVDECLSLVLVWNEFPSHDDELPDVAIGKEMRWMTTRDALFWPYTAWFDGSYLWVGETKFSGRLLRFSIGGRVETGLTEHEGGEIVPAEYSLRAAFPNPFNARTTIAFDLPEKGYVSLKVYDILGRTTRTLAEGEFEAGRHRVAWDGRDDEGKDMASGVYMIRLVVEGKGAWTRKVALVR